MSLGLSRTKGKPSVKTWGLLSGQDMVQFGQYDIDINDFFAATFYVLTNTDLYKNDPRVKFVSRIKKLKRIKGYMKGNRRFAGCSLVY